MGGRDSSWPCYDGTCTAPAGAAAERSISEKFTAPSRTGGCNFRFEASRSLLTK
jgi:hypothetical protein